MRQDPEAEIAARLSLAVARAHRGLADDELALVRARITRDLEHRGELRATPLENGDPPDPPFDPLGVQA